MGYSDLFIENANKMDISLLSLDYLILSHSHLDHTWGLSPLISLYTEAIIENRDYQKPELLTHPATFDSRFIGEVGEIGSLVTKEKAAIHFKLNLSKEPVWLTDRLVFLGEILRKNDFEARTAIGRIIQNGKEKEDYILEDTALAYKSSKGLVIITGCSHAGICNIIEHAKQVCQEDKVYDIIGGLHLLQPSEKQLQGTINYLKELKPEVVHACHCTDLQSKIALSRVSKLQEIGVGMELKYD
ncbi:MBL fold metallo-hydrolase [Halocella sp. SP3-1]|uniref:MBL fold metallo-hydrolase n=1 Tax=Halocella sp. SP3-1 TaxID=2382161 RepID=UPI00257116E7|nr:MBL fold metallo-hydrolase [Halocella sp. SP3-1]